MFFVVCGLSCANCNLPLVLLKLVLKQEQTGSLELSLFLHLCDFPLEVEQVVLFVRARFRSGLAGGLASLGFGLGHHCLSPFVHACLDLRNDSVRHFVTVDSVAPDTSKILYKKEERGFKHHVAHDL